MSVEMITVVIWSALLLMLITGVPIAFGLIVISAVGFLAFVGPQALYAIFPPVFGSLIKDVYLAVPLFIFMAGVLEVSGIGARMYDVMYKWLASVRGGLSIGTVVICTLIAAMTGLSGTGTMIMGMLAYPEMRKRGYDKGLAVGSIMAGGMLGPLIPPSLPMIILAGLAGISVGKLFMAGVFPGALCALLFMAYIGVRCLYKPSLGPPIPPTERANWREKIAGLVGVIPPGLLIILVLGGIYSGACTPTEAGAVGAIGSMMCAALYRNLNYKNLYLAAKRSLGITIMALWLVLAGTAFSSLLGFVGVTQFVSNLMTGLQIPPIGVLAIMIFIILILGMFMETAAILMITVPVMTPIAVALGIDLVWFGFLISMALIIGMITPPFGYVLFFFKGLGHKDLNMGDIYRSILPFIPFPCIILVLCIVFPEIALWLPRMMIG